MEQSPFWEVKRFSASQKNPPFYIIQRFITAFTRARYLSLSCATSIQSMSQPTCWKYFLILYSYLHLALSSDLLSSGHATRTFSMPATCPAHLILLYLITRIVFDEEHSSCSFSLYNVYHSPVTSSFFFVFNPALTILTSLSRLLLEVPRSHTRTHDSR